MTRSDLLAGLLGVVALIVLQGCSLAGKARPVLAYKDTTVPFADTAVFAPMAQHQGSGQVNNMGGGVFVLTVDGAEANSHAVRVLPGNHSFGVSYTVPFAQGAARVEVTDMRAGHVYAVTVARSGNRFKVDPVDLGSAPDLGIYLGLKGVNLDFYPFQF